MFRAVRDVTAEAGAHYLVYIASSCDERRKTKVAVAKKRKKFRGLLRGVLLARPKVTTQGAGVLLAARRA